MRLRVASFLLLFVGLAAGIPSVSFAADWPMWRYDAGRTAASPEVLPGRIHLQWSRQYSPRKLAWDDALNRDRMPFDRCFEPIIAGNRIFMGFNDTDKVVALDLDTGEEQWAFYTEGPVRMPPVAFRGRVLFASDDGYLYCLDAASGELQWKFRGGPSDRKILGNERLISTWPARGGPVEKDGRLYFAASIWPMMGTFIYCLDAETGAIVWKNDATGAQWLLQPHTNPAFAGVAPQGAFAISGDRLLIPGGRTQPACFDLDTGEFLYYHLDSTTGGSFVCAAKDIFFNHHRNYKVLAGEPAHQIASLYRLEDGESLDENFGACPVLTDMNIYIGGESVTAYTLDVKPKEQWTAEVDASEDLIFCGNRLYAAGKDKISALDVEKRKVVWEEKVDGGAVRLLAGNGKLVAVTMGGGILVYGDAKVQPAVFASAAASPAVPQPAAERAKRIVEATGVTEGYALVHGVGEGALVEALAQSTALRMVALDPALEQVAQLRRELDAADRYGSRAAVLAGDPMNTELPPYMASLTVVDDPARSGFAPTQAFLQRLFASMRPYGGKAWLPLTGDDRTAFKQLAQDSGLHGLTAEDVEGGLLLSREGPLAGAGEWTHQYGDPANTVKSDDALVKMPLGVLWFGGSSNEDVLPRHGHGPSEQIIGGRLFIEGMDCMNARDVYTGRVLWNTPLGDLGTYDVYYDETYPSQQHIPGANARGSNFVAALDKVYVVQGAACKVLDAVTGERSGELVLPKGAEGEDADWGYIAILGDTLVASSGFVPFTGVLTEEERNPAGIKPKHRPFFKFDKTASRRLLAMDRHTGAVHWEMAARHGFLHNGIVVAGETVYCLDKVSPYVEKALQRRGQSAPETNRLAALDLATGAEKWSAEENVFGSWLGYSEEYDILLQATRPSSDMVRGEDGERMIAYEGATGKVLWDIERSYSNPPILHGEHIITYQTMYDLRTGAQVERIHPITGETVPWTYEQTKGCGYHIACENLVTFRSSAAAYFDLEADDGTGHFGGFKSGCSANLIAADGLLNAPDYTRTCVCSYQNQTSLALIHMPEVDVWSTYPEAELKGPVRRLGLNFGASGDRRAEDGTLWIEYPVVAGASPDIGVKVTPESGAGLRYINHHSSHMQGAGPNWIGASCAEGITRVDLTLAEGGAPETPCTVRLVFGEPGELPEGQRVFSVLIQGEEVLKDFDPVREAGGPRRTVVREFRKISVRDALRVEFLPAQSAPLPEPVLCGLEVIAENPPIQQAKR